jgi:sterol desaturase/sphingolipid hydroxylase (fatty acid hydroxylase superfamily)
MSDFSGAPTIDLQNIKNFISDAPEIIVWAAPILFLFVLIEWTYSKLHNSNNYNKKETLASISVGIGNIFISFLLKFAIFYIIILVYNMLPWRLYFNWWTLIPCYIALDFCSYWAHRISHHQRFWWATHVVHHSGENFNLTTAFRLSWVQHIKIIFFLPVALCGFHPIIFFIANQIAILFQFWVHTEYIKKLPQFFEYIFATPSNHRVHHGSQDKFINKNFGATFILWDRIFHTYQAEDEKAVYGLTHKLDKPGNPFYINFHEFIDIWKDVRRADGIKKKMFYLFGDPIDIAKHKMKFEDKSKRAKKSDTTGKKALPESTFVSY